MSETLVTTFFTSPRFSGERSIRRSGAKADRVRGLSDVSQGPSPGSHALATLSPLCGAREQPHIFFNLTSTGGPALMVW
jgi:hypothetical protein